MHILNVARALRFHSNMPIRFWGKCIKTTTYLINRMPTTVLQGKSPYELLYKKEPHIEHIRVFGCLCFVLVLPRQDKFSQRAKRSIFMDTQRHKRDTESWVLRLVLFL